MAWSTGEDLAARAEYQFANIASIVVTRDETMWVVDGAPGPTPSVRQYDAAGKFLRHVGRAGSGPGEYRNPDGLALLPDGRVVLRDFGLPDRLTLYAPNGALDTTWSLGRPRYRDLRMPIEVDTAGVIWLTVLERPRPDRPPPSFLRIREGTILDSVPLPALPDVERNQLRITRTLPSGGLSIRGFAVPYQPRSTWAWSPFGNFAVAATDSYRITILPLPGVRDSVPESVWRDVEPIPVPDAEREKARRDLTASVRAEKGGSDLSIPEIPAYKPPILRVNFSADGQLLVYVSMPSRFEDGEWSEPRAVDVFDAAGAFKGRILLPDSFTIEFMRGHDIWGVFHNADGVESIRRYHVTWPERSGGL